MADCSVVITLAVLLAIQSVCCTQTTYFVKPTPDTPCPSESCLTLSEYAQGAGPLFTSNTTMVFLPGDHQLYNDMGITNITSFTMVGDSTTLPDITSNIVCTGPAAFIFQNISYLKIQALELSYCGSATLAAVQLSAIPQFELSHSAFYNSRNTSLEATGSGLTISESIFHGSSSAGLMLWGCTAEFLGSNVFSNNLKSGVFSYVSFVEFNGSTTFVNNSGECGGGIYAANTRIHCSGQCTTFTRDVSGGDSIRCNGGMSFVQNSAEQGGGICAILESDLKLGGNVTFINNSAIIGGGIIMEDQSRLSCNGVTSFVGNSADLGGGIQTMESRLTFVGSTSFVSNSANSGGGIHMIASSLSCEGLISFLSNLANLGGGISGSDGNQVEFSGNTSFIHNIAFNGGGGFISHGKVSANGFAMFADNSASKGGALRVQDSTVVFEGHTSIVNNSAARNGGGIHTQDSRWSCKGLTSFVNNSAAQDGGGIMIEHSGLSFEGHISFVNNSAAEGGAILIQNSTLRCEGFISFVNNSAVVVGGGISCYTRTQITFTTLLSNTGQYGRSSMGGIEMKNDSIALSNECVTFANNSAGLGGGIYLSKSSMDFCNGSSIFIQNSALYGGGILLTRSASLTVNGTCTFTNNTANYIGGAMHILKSSQVTLAGNTKFIHNSAGYGGGMYFQNSSLAITGNTDLYNNMATNGGGVHGTMATITINGSTTFEDNYAMANGGGLSLSSTSQFILAANRTMYFINNHAEQYGGAIYVADDPFEYCTTFDSSTLWGQCFFQLQKSAGDSSVMCVIVNNTAGKAGTAVYGGMVDRCMLTSYSTEPGQVFNGTFHITEQNSATTSIIASDPYQVCPCSSGQPNCSTYSISVTVYPGEIFLVRVVAVGQRYGTVPAVVKSSLEDELTKLGSLQAAQSVNNTCTALQYIIYSSSSKETMTLTAEGPCLEMGKPLIINITLLQCPTAFMLSNSTKACTCEKRLQKYTNKCNITSRKIDRDSEFWVGRDSGLGGTILHPHCPFDYCRSYPVSFALNETDLQCSYDRTGLLCGGCQPGLSNVLGSSRCIKCSSAYLSLLIPFALAGIALVAFLLLCNLTVTVGSVNGLIFYANIIAVNRSVFLPSGQENALTIFIAWLNLDMGIETCFYDGMDAYARTWLQFAFPLFVWVLVGTIVILSHYYGAVARMFGRNPIAVLATLFFLSYAKLLRTIIAVFSFTNLEYPDGAEVAVWLYDGNVRYLKGKHIPLFLTALLVLLLLFLPYTLLLLFGQWIQTHSEKRIFSWISDYRVKPFLDAYHAPYRNEYRYWPGLLLVFRCVLFLVFAFNILGNPSVNLLAISVCTTVLVIFTRFTGKVYTNRYLDANDASYLLNIGVLAAATFYVRSVGGRQDILVYTSLSIAFTTFLGILIYHVSAQIRDSRVWKEIIWPKLQRMRQWRSTSLHRDLSDADTQGTELQIVSAHAPTTTFVDLRELLLEDNHDIV